jgi:hypothetical protein
LGWLNKTKSQINQRFKDDKQEKSARILKGIPEKPCIYATPKFFNLPSAFVPLWLDKKTFWCNL